jgi:hypothetical protein
MYVYDVSRMYTNTAHTHLGGLVNNDDVEVFGGEDIAVYGGGGTDYQSRVQQNVEHDFM